MDLSLGDFRKSSRCESAGCVEVAIGDSIIVRNSEDPQRTVHFTKAEWRAFVAGVRIGEFEPE
jgi:hypothetical protein